MSLYPNLDQIETDTKIIPQMSVGIELVRFVNQILWWQR